jgi:hypothetical protein
MNASSRCCVEEGADPWKRAPGDGDRRWSFVMTALRSTPVWKLHVRTQVLREG